MIPAPTEPNLPAAAQSAPGRSLPALTARQREALVQAVQLGYYEVPRSLSLHELAARLGIGAGSLSELLRRAETAVLKAYVADAAPERPHVGGAPARSEAPRRRSRSSKQGSARLPGPQIAGQTIGEDVD